jgi:hypothetical protein
VSTVLLHKSFTGYCGSGAKQLSSCLNIITCEVLTGNCTCTPQIEFTLWFSGGESKQKFLYIQLSLNEFTEFDANHAHLVGERQLYVKIVAQVIGQAIYCIIQAVGSLSNVCQTSYLNSDIG